MTKLPVVKIFSFHYRPGDTNIGDNSYVHVWVGKNQSSNESKLKGDNTGDNISSKNKYYSELTGIYWAWKNNSADIWGTCHYRRFFTIHQEPFIYKFKRLAYYLIGIGRKRHGLIYTSDFSYWRKKVINKEEIEALMTEYEAIMPTRRKLKYSILDHYKRYHNLADLKLLREIITDRSPEFLNVFDEMLVEKRLYANNMMILKNDRFNELVNWLFEILFEFEKRVELNNYLGYQQRILGFLSERLITCWFLQKRLNTIELNLIYFKKLKK